MDSMEYGNVPEIREVPARKCVADRGYKADICPLMDERRFWEMFPLDKEKDSGRIAAYAAQLGG